ncbi:hypothetical protein RH858_12710 [Halalkaliarchaeum sp. AArc-GB]|uniref:hypothetical protein n=1 Tax=Halalkaliarchaeum sp. AArc-GB TaxID=3074078 RepID=UPI00285F8FB0|nr:hypothetical protein [Halalkaliarchaeum sp. AArc-GB]MDR5674006.1 hypothetical protein [Halalkaliarchaeum sp. AArc-GB]
MVEVTYHCPYCGAVTGIERDGYLRDKCVTREPLDGWEYADTTGDVEAADGIEFVCLGTGATEEKHSSTDVDDPAVDRDPDVAGPAVDRDGCGRTFYLNYVKFEDGKEVPHRQPEYDRPRFDFRR